MRWKILSIINSILENQAERWALGSAYRIVQRHANTAVSYLTTIENYKDGLEMTREYAAIQKTPIPPRVTLNKNNVPKMQMTLYEVNRKVRFKKNGVKVQSKVNYFNRIVISYSLSFYLALSIFEQRC